MWAHFWGGGMSCRPPVNADLRLGHADRLDSAVTSHLWPGVPARAGRPPGQSGGYRHETENRDYRRRDRRAYRCGWPGPPGPGRWGPFASARAGGGGVGLWPNALTALASIGLAGKVAQLAVELAGQGIKRPDGAWLLCIPGEVMAQRWGAGFVLVHRAELQKLLASELGPSFIHLGA